MIGGFSRGGGCFGGVFPSGLFAGEDKMRAPPFPLRFVLFWGFGRISEWWVSGLGFGCGYQRLIAVVFLVAFQFVGPLRRLIS